MTNTNLTAWYTQALYALEDGLEDGAHWVLRRVSSFMGVEEFRAWEGFQTNPLVLLISFSKRGKVFAMMYCADKA